MARRAQPRRTPPLRAQLEAAKRQIVALMKRLGMISADLPDDCVRLECDHEPALGLRDVDPISRQHIPHQHDSRYLVFRPEASHDIKTRGRGATTAGSDVGEMRKTRQLVRARVERGDVDPADPSIAPWAPEPDRKPAPPKRTWPKRSLPAGRTIQSRSSLRREERAR